MVTGLKKLHHYIEAALPVFGTKTYVKLSDKNYTYQDVYDLSQQFAKVFRDNGIKKNDRIVLYSSKNPGCIAAMIASSTCEAIYVPVSSVNPAGRAIQIVDESEPAFIICDEYCKNELTKYGKEFNQIFILDGLFIFRADRKNSDIPIDEDTGFILFTSGSTGTPKGVVISHQAAMVFVDWAADEFQITDKDILSSIAPFNFDLSVFDIYVTARQGATLVLYTENDTKNALLMAQKLSLDEVTTIYATPTFYSTLAYYGKLQKYGYASLKNILFAGEVFHLESFNKLLEYWPGISYINLYGPTETNVCTFYRVDLQRKDLLVFPIGMNCPYADSIIINEENEEVRTVNEPGELLVSGDSLFYSYWRDPVKSETAFFIDKENRKFYRTGDIVSRNEERQYMYIARKDRMIKKNGYRIEPSEIEKVILTHPGVSNAAVLFIKDKNLLVCFMESAEIIHVDLPALKIFCQNYLPLYMIPDKFVILTSMPKTSSGKIDLQALKESVL